MEEKNIYSTVIECPCGNTNFLRSDNFDLLSELICFKCFTKGSFKIKEGGR